MKFTYEELKMTPVVHVFIKNVYNLTDAFPNNEKFGLSSQARRSATSVLLNLAEGSARYSNAEFARFTKIAIGSLVETDAALKLATTLGYVTSEQLKEVNNFIQELFLNSLRSENHS